MKTNPNEFKSISLAQEKLSRHSTPEKTRHDPIEITVKLNDPELLLNDELLEKLVSSFRSDLINARTRKRHDKNFVHTYIFDEPAESTLVISSTFSANSLLPTLTPLLQEFSETKAVVTYNDFSEQLLNPNSQFRNNKRGVNVLLYRFEDFDKKNQEEQDFQENLNNLFDQIKQYAETNETPLLLCCCPQQYPSQWKTIEEAFLRNILENRLAYVIQDRDIQIYYPTSNLYDEFGKKEAHLPYVFEYFNALSKMIVRFYYAFITNPKKVIVLDCDDTLWKGKVGEDGVQGIIIDESRRHFQNFLVEKSKQGFLLCLCSRNNEEDVLAVFKEREDMILKSEHIADWRIDWNKKSENIRSLSDALNLALNSFIFIDDDPAQVGEVNIGCPEVLSLQIPQQERLIPIFIRSIWGLEDFGKYSHSKKVDDSRTKHYQNNSKRNALKKNASSFNDYLKQLKLKTTIRFIEEKDYPRVAELMQRSNQFNFNKWSPEQCTEVHLRNLIKNENYKCLLVDAEDRYDNYGLVGLMLYHLINGFLLVEAFVLSCRALGKGVEHQLLKEFSQQALSRGQFDVYILFQATQSNKPASAFLQQTGFQQQKTAAQQTIYSLPVRAALEVNAMEWEQTETTNSADTLPPVNPALLNQNDFAKRMVENTVDHYARKEEVDYVSISPRILDSVEGITEYIKNLGKCFDRPIHNEYSLVELGYDSSLAVHFVSEVYKDLGIYIKYTDILQPNCKLESLAGLIFGKLLDTKNITYTPNKNKTEPFPLSREQQRLWNFYCHNPDSSKYNMSITYQLQGNLNIDALQSAFRYLLQIETIFCTVFTGDFHHSSQRIVPENSLTFQWKVEEEQNLALSQIEQKTQQFINQPFRLEQDLLLRVQLFRVEDQKYIITVCIPHIIHDAVSLNLLMTRLAEYYSAFLRGEIPKDENRYPFQYNDYVSWQQSESSEVMQNHQAYWKKQLAGVSNLNLPIMKKAIPSQKSKRLCFSLEQEMTKSLEQIATQSQATIYQVLLTIFSVLLSKYTGQLDTLILTPTSGRQHPNAHRMIGFFVNLLFINTHLKEDSNFFKLISEVQEVILNGLQHQDYPFIDQLSLLENPETTLPISFIFQNYDAVSFPLSGIDCVRVFSDNNSILYDMTSETRLGPLSMYMRKEGNQVSGLIEYDEALFTEQEIQRFIFHFQNLIYNIIIEPNKPVLSHSLLTALESKQILEEWNNPSNDSVQSDKDILSLYQYHVNANPNGIAIRLKDRQMSYGELDKASTQLGTYLKQELPTLTSEDRIATYLPRNAYEAIAIIGILKANCAYVPINQTDPIERIQYILQDTEAKAILVTQENHVSFDFFQGKKIAIDNKEIFNVPIPDTIRQPTKPSQLAYIMYTSGSTGRPKGVLIEQQGIMRLVISPNYIKLNQEDKIAQLSNSSFDAATFEFWGGLLNGATLVYPDKNVLSDLNEFSQFLSDNQITTSFITSALFEAFALLMPAVFKNLNYLITGGDILNPKAIAAIINCSEEDRPAHLLHAYGPTENTTFSTTYEITTKDIDQENSPIPIGYPIAQTQVYVLDAQQQPVPIGVPGFLYVGGMGLARGYLNQPELTHNKFIEIMISGVKKRLYYTGDIVFWRSDGS